MDVSESSMFKDCLETGSKVDKLIGSSEDDPDGEVADEFGTFPCSSSLRRLELLNMLGKVRVFRSFMTPDGMADLFLSDW